MKKTLKKATALLLVVILAVTCLVMTGCKQEPKTYSTEEHVTLNMAVLYNKLRMVYTDADGSTPFTAANGKTYNIGDFKPVWEELQTRLNCTFVDAAVASATATNDSFDELKLTNFEGVNMINAGTSRIIEYGLQGSFVDLSQHLDYMPNFKSFLESNPAIANQIKAGDGATYYAPYFDGYDDIEKTFIMRIDWVEKLLDGDGQTYDTAKEIGEIYYSNYMPESLSGSPIEVESVTADGTATQVIAKDYAKNIVLIQNELEVKNGETLTNALKQYIDDTYGDTYAKRSDLFCGQDACWDADELVALLRCVVCNTEFLTGQADNQVVGIWPREYTTNRTQELIRFAQMWGVRGLEARSQWFYLDSNGELQDARLNADTMDGLEMLNQLYKEGLILQDFDQAEASGAANGNHRDALCKANLGFMTYDYVQTTCAVNNYEECKAYAGFNLAPVLNPVANWDGDYMRFTESWRSVKTEGWAITSATTELELERCLTLIDYLYSEAGNTLMSYGPEAWIDGTIEYKGQTVPKLSDAAITELNTLAKGNYTNYYRMWLGGTFPVGYIKQQGMEYQTVAANGKVGLEKVENAIGLGVIKHVVFNDAAAEGNPDWMIIPTSFALDDQDNALIKDECQTLSSNFNPGSKAENNLVYISYIKYGFEGTDASGEALLSKQGLIDATKTWGGEKFLNIYKAAYADMLAPVVAE